MKKLALGLVSVFAFSGAAFAFGPHDSNCVDCHSLHYAKGSAILSVKPNTAEKNPISGKTAADDVALCLGCHNNDQGIMPIMLSSTHPVGIKPVKAQVPAELLRKDGTLGCMSCHEPHPSNPNYKYLRGEPKKSSDLGKYCSLCHPEKVENKTAAAAPAAPAPAKKP